LTSSSSSPLLSLTPDGKKQIQKKKKKEAQESRVEQKSTSDACDDATKKSRETELRQKWKNESRFWDDGLSGGLNDIPDLLLLKKGEGRREGETGSVE